MIKTSENLDKIFTALSKAQGLIRAAKKNKTNPFHKSDYADLAGIWQACREALSQNGLSVTQVIDNNNGEMVLISILGHTSGQWIQGEMPIVLSDKKPQTIGSTLTYYRRYALSALIGVAPDDGEDDDGQEAQNNHNEYIQKNMRYQPKNMEVKNSPPQYIKTISEKEANELKDLLMTISIDQQRKITDDLQKRKWLPFLEIPQESFLNIKKHILEIAAKEKQLSEQKQEVLA